jgi:hypothetical protein
MSAMVRAASLQSCSVALFDDDAYSRAIYLKD